MNLEELIAVFRSETDDRMEPFLFDAADIARWLSEGEEEAALRARLIFESDNAAICQIVLLAGTRVYPLHPSLIDITYVSLQRDGSSEVCALQATDRHALDLESRDWRTYPRPITQFVQHEDRIELAGPVEHAGILRLEGFRLPLKRLNPDNDAQSPEINRKHHRHLVRWAMYRGYGRPDAETYNAGKAAAALDEFEHLFGPSVRAASRRTFHAGLPHRNRVHFP